MTTEVGVLVGKRIRRRRRLLGMTQLDLAGQCGVSFQQIQKYECATSRSGIEMWWKLACALETDMSYFFEGLEAGRTQAGANVPSLPSALVA